MSKINNCPYGCSNPKCKVDLKGVLKMNKKSKKEGISDSLYKSFLNTEQKEIADKFSKKLQSDESIFGSNS